MKLLAAQTRQETPGFGPPNPEARGEYCRALIVCRDLGGLKAMQSEAAGFQSGVVVVSDDPRVQKAASESIAVADVAFLEKMESYYCVSDDVIDIIRQINHWLESLGEESAIPKDLLYWVMHCEGGDTSQRVLDVLLLMRSYEDLVDRYHPHEIVLIRSVNPSWEDDLLLAFAGSVGIGARLSGRLGFSGWFHHRVWLRWRPVAVGVYLTVKIVQVKLANLLRRQFSVENEKSVIVQLVSSSKTHLNHTRPLVKALNSVSLHAMVLGWRLGESAALLRSDGIAVVELETWVTLRDLISGWLRTLRSWRRARANSSVFLTDGQRVSKSELFRGILFKAMRSFYLSELVGGYYLQSAARRFFHQFQPRALRPHSLVLPDGVIPYREIRKIDKNFLTFIQGGWPYNFPEPITDCESPIPKDKVVFCSCGKLHRDILQEKGFLQNNLHITGLHWIEPITEFKRKFSKTDSREALGLNPHAEMYALYDPSSVLRGYLSSQERYLVLQSILTFAEKNPRLQLMIKPHPTHRVGVLEALVSERSLPNVRLIDQSLLPYHALNAADILVFRFSTLAIEAMFMSVPALGILLNNEENFKCYGSAVEYCSDLPSMQARLQALIDDPKYRQKWIDDLRARQSVYFENHGLVSSGNPAQSVADIVLSRLTGGPRPAHHLGPAPHCL